MCSKCTHEHGFRMVYVYLDTHARTHARANTDVSRNQQYVVCNNSKIILSATEAVTALSFDEYPQQQFLFLPRSVSL